jgi:hypothetical protein
MSEKIDFNNNPIEKAIFEIEILKREVAVMGANDFEIPTLNTLIDNIRNKELSPEEGLKQAQAIRYGKQDYH